MEKNITEAKADKEKLPRLFGVEAEYHTRAVSMWATSTGVKIAIVENIRSKVWRWAIETPEVNLGGGPFATSEEATSAVISFMNRIKAFGMTT